MPQSLEVGLGHSTEDYDNDAWIFLMDRGYRTTNLRTLTILRQAGYCYSALIFYKKGF